MLPTRDEAEKILKDAEQCNPGPWGNHSRIAARCAETIAVACGDLDGNKAYILGLLHDIGRKFGVRHLGHVSDGYSYMISLGYDEVAKVCLTHSFNNQSLDEYVGKVDTTEKELAMIQNVLDEIVLDDYDRLIQLCDALAGSESVLDIEERMQDVKNRYGFYPQKKWDKNIELKNYFENKADKNIYIITGKMMKVTVDRPLGSYHPEYPDMYYPVNYGYVKGIMAADGEEQDAYILGVNEPVKEFIGKVIAIIHRKDDVEEKWVVAPESISFSKEEIMEQVLFQEQYFESEVRMQNNEKG